MSAAAEERFRFRALPILFTVLLALGISFLAFLTVEFLKLAVHLREPPEMPWIAGYYYNLAALVYTLMAIFVLKRQRPGGYGLQRPEGRSYVGAAILWGVALGVVMAAVDYAPQLATMRRLDRPLAAFNMVGWFSYAGLFLGTAEEVLFRGLLITYLARKLPGRIALGRFALSGAGVVVAVIYALSYVESSLNETLAVALGQFVYALASGLLFAYWCEKSKSLLAPIIGHNISGMIEQAIVFAMMAAFR